MRSSCPLPRFLIAVFLCLLLPLQSGIAFARSAGMVSVHRAAAQTASPAASPQAETLQVAHAIGKPHQHDAHAHHEHRQLKKASPSARDDSKRDHSGSHKSRHASGACQDCAKCCVTAAAAPPPASLPTLQPSAVRSAFLPSVTRIRVHTPDGPERPPRSLTA